MKGRGNFHTEEIKEYCKEKSIGRVWINNGEISKMMYITEDLPKGWKRGRLIKQDKKGRIIGNGDRN